MKGSGVIPFTPVGATASAEQDFGVVSSPPTLVPADGQPGTDTSGSTRVSLTTGDGGSRRGPTAGSGLYCVLLRLQSVVVDVILAPCPAHHALTFPKGKMARRRKGKGVGCHSFYACWCDGIGRAGFRGSFQSTHARAGRRPARDRHERLDASQPDKEITEKTRKRVDSRFSRVRAAFPSRRSVMRKPCRHSRCADDLRMYSSRASLALSASKPSQPLGAGSQGTTTSS